MRSLCILVGFLWVSGVLPGTPSAAGALDDIATETTATLGPVQVGKALPTFAGYDLNGEMLRWSRFVSKDAAPEEAIVVSVFATWCKPCKHGLQVIRDVAQSDPNMRVLLIDFQEAEPLVKSWLTDLGLSVPTVADQYGTVSKRLGVASDLPRTFLVDGRGVTHAIFTKEGGDFEQVLRAEINKMRSVNGFSGVRKRGAEILEATQQTLDEHR